MPYFDDILHYLTDPVGPRNAEDIKAAEILHGQNRAWLADYLGTQQARRAPRRPGVQLSFPFAYPTNTELNTVFAQTDESWDQFLSTQLSPQQKVEKVLTQKIVKKFPWKQTVAFSLLGLWTLNRFSGHDDYYNTIEGMSETGLAARQRKINTDFGSGYKGLGLIGAGLGALAGLRGLGYLNNHQSTTPKDSEESHFIRNTLITGASVGAALTAAPVLAQGLLIKKAGGSWKNVLSTLKPAFLSETKRQAASFRSTLGMHFDKGIVTNLKKAGSVQKDGLYSTMFGRALMPLQKTAGLVHHTAEWLRKNWMPELKKFEPGALVLGAATVYETYHIGKDAYEGDYAGVAKGLATFAAAKYAYMGYFHTMRTPAMRKATFNWVKSQSKADWMTYGASALSLAGSTKEAILHSGSYYASFVRTGAPVKDYAAQYGLNITKNYSEYANYLSQSYSKAYQNMPEDIKKEVISAFNIGELKEAGSEVVNRAPAEHVDLFLKDLQNPLFEFQKKSWLYNKAVSKVEAANRENMINIVSQVQDALKSGVNTFSGKGSAFNTIEGMRHGGVAGRTRSVNTDFGSGFLGFGHAVKRAMFSLRFGRGLKQFGKYIGLSAKKTGSFINPKKAAELARSSSTVEDFANLLGVGEITAVRRSFVDPAYEAKLSSFISDKSSLPNLINQLEQAGAAAVVPGPKNPNLFIGIDVPFLLQQSGTNLKGINQESFLKSIMYHEYLEKQSYKAFGFANKMKSHFAGQVITGEAAFLKEFGDKELYSLIRKGRIAQSPEERFFFKIGENFNKARNAFDGMQHGGLAQSLRHLFTPFGSKYDTVRALAKMTKQTMEQLTSSTSFKKALTSASYVGRLGAGSFGEVGLYEATYKGKKFFTAKKTIKEGVESIIQQSADPEYYKKALDLSREASFYKQFGWKGENKTIPSLHGLTDNALYMEYMPGEVMAKYATENKGKLLPKRAVRKLRRTLQEMSEVGVLNKDIHGGNVMYDPKSGRVSFIDLGLAERMHPIDHLPTQQVAESYGSEMNQILNKEVHGIVKPYQVTPSSQFSTGHVETPVTVKKNISPTLLQRKSQNLTLLADNLKLVQKELWEAARSGGRKHVAFRSTMSGGS